MYTMETPWKSMLPAAKRPTHQRADSNSSEVSHGSQASLDSHGSDEQFAFSPLHTPAKENPPSRVMFPRYATDPSTARHGMPRGRELQARSRHSEISEAVTSDPSFISPSSQAKPIAIELPGQPNADPTSATASHPPEPLSARGDIPGGYFPLHEDPESRVRIPHPFHSDFDMARQTSLQRAAESSKSGAESRLSGTSDAEPPSYISMIGPASPSASPHTPVSSYIPSGLHDDVVLPMGKYYPSNWEKRHGQSPRHHRPSTAAYPTAAPAKSEPQIPKYHVDHDAAHHRPGSDVKRRLQQYQRDMVAQAAMAANAVLANSASSSTAPASSSAGPSAPGGGLSLSTAQLAAAFLKTHKPLSPRLRPMGSPGGPVTPMSLEGDCYLTFRTPRSGMDLTLPAERAHSRASSCSSPVELNAVSV